MKERGARWLLGALLLGIVGAVVAGSGGTGAAADGLPSSAQVISQMEFVADHWIANNSPTATDDKWANATFNSGNMALFSASQNTKYYNYSERWAASHSWTLNADTSTKPFNADNQAAGQVYLDLYAIDQKSGELTSLENRISAQMASGSSQYWTWADALNMAMPGMARLGVMNGNEAMLEYMQSSFNYTEQVAGGGLFSENAGLWWRDSSYVGTTTFWSRGNGWVFIALAKVLAALPASDPRRPEYLRVYQKMAAALLPIQRSDGFWNADLGDPTEYPGPETSGTAFFTFGLAWGINSGLLDSATYLPAVQKAWNGMN